MSIFRAFKDEQGLITLVEQDSELFNDLVEEGTLTLVPALDKEVSDSGTPLPSEPRYDRVTGRYYMYSNGAWITDCDDNYSTAYVLFLEQAGTGSEPIYEWEHMGEYYPAGSQIKSFTLTGRCNNSQLTDLEIRLVAKYPNDPEAWNSGFNSDTQVSTQTIFSGLYSDMGVPVGAKNNITRGKIDLDVTLDQDSYICMYIRKVGSLSGTRYFTGSRILEVI